MANKHTAAHSQLVELYKPLIDNNFTVHMRGCRAAGDPCFS